MHDEFTDRLSEYLDGELSDGERRALDAHLETCAACVATLDDLRQVREEARGLSPRPPAIDLWPGIASRIGAHNPARVVRFGGRPPRRFSFTLPQLAAASLLLAAVSGTVAWQLRAPSVSQPPPPAVQTTAAPSPAPPDVQPVSLADAQYDAAVADLQRALEEGRGRLDPATIAVLEKNLAIIDRAIADATRAVVSDPGNSYLTNHLVEARRKKLDLLRRATALASGGD